MAYVRLLFLALVAAFAVCMVLHRLTGNIVWRQRAMGIVKWGVVVGLIGFGAIILRRAAVFV